MAMPLEKAKKVLGAYKDSNYNAMQALTSVGYSSETADKQSARTIDTAVNTIARSNDKDAIFEYLGITENDIAKEYLKVINQDKNYPAKLRALEPLLKKKGIQWDEQKINMNPTLNLTVKETGSTEPLKQIDSVAQARLCDINCTAQHEHIIDDEDLSHIIDNTSRRLDSPNQDNKEEDRPTQNFDQKVTIDNKEEVLPTYTVVTEMAESEDEVDFIESLEEENE